MRKHSIFHDSKSNNLIFKKSNKVVPIVVNIGRKDKKQISASIKRHKSDYGIIVSNNYSFIKKERKIIFIPLKTFSFI